MNHIKTVLLSTAFMICINALFGCSNGTGNTLNVSTPVPSNDITDSTRLTNKSELLTSTVKIENGQKQFKQLGFSGCHNTDSTKLVGPGLAGIGDRGDEYIRNSITNPSAEIVDGYLNLMPSSFASLDDSDLDALVAYLKTLN